MPAIVIVKHGGPHGDLDTALRRALDDGAAIVAWLDPRRRDALSEPDTWPDRLGPAPEVRHLGLHTTPSAVLRALQAVAGEDPFVVPTIPRGCRVSWLVSPIAGVAHARALRVMLRIGVPPGVGSAAAWAWRGWQASRAGVLPVHDDALRGDAISDGAESQPSWSRPDIAWLIDRRWRPIRPWRVRLRSLATPRHGPTSLSVDRWPTLPPPPTRHDDVDVVIPTLGRPDALGDVLDDLAAQRRTPRRVVIVEQHAKGEMPVLGARLERRDDPFLVVHRTTDQLGASRARNRALDDTAASWIALLDDDVRLAPDFLEATLAEARLRGAHALNVGERTPDAAEDPRLSNAEPSVPCAGIGSGRCLIARDALVAIGGFDEQIEGWGEDQELGLRLNLAGARILQSRAIRLVHLRAPSGGFRALAERPKPPWSQARPTPKPSPLIVYRWLRWSTPAGRRGSILGYLLDAMQGRVTSLVSLPWLIWRLRQAQRYAHAMVEDGPRLRLDEERAP